MRRPPMWLRKLLRPLIPDRLMARYRLAEHSRQVRTNVDVFLPPGSRAIRRWLATTPDTYRVRHLAAGRSRPNGVVHTWPDDGEHADTAAALLADPDLDVGVVAEVAPPRLVGRRRVEPAMAPIAIAAADAAWQEAGGPPAAPQALPGLLQRLRATGQRIGLVPVPPAGAPLHRTDPIDAPAVVIFSLVPIHDVGGGSRSAQMALELLRRGYHVTYAAAFGTAESVDLGLRYIHPQLEQARVDELDVDALTARLRREERIAIVEAPAPAWAGHVRSLRAAGFRIVYDLIDDWSAPSLGGDWYRPDVAEWFASTADARVASAPDLVAALEPYGPARLVPNAVNAALFEGDPGPAPADLPTGDGPLLGYHGSLHGDWFDWNALRAVAERHGDARLVVIGDPPPALPPLPGNVHLLGLKPQPELPGYLARFDAGLVPFVVSDVTHAVSPLKVYEYLAAGVPVAAPPLRALEGLDGVHTGASLADAVVAALAAPRPDGAEIIEQHSWGVRLRTLFAAAGRELAAVSDPGARIVIRPATHWSRAERRP